MKPCPYRKTHEFDADGLCKNCYAKEPAPEVVEVDLESRTLDEILQDAGTVTQPMALPPTFPWPWGAGGGTTP